MNFKVAIIGTNYTAALSAMILIKSIPSLEGNIHLYIKEQSQFNIISSLSELTQFHTRLGLKEDIFIQGTSAYPNLGATIHRNNTSRIFTDAEYGFSYRGAKIHQLLSKSNSQFKIEEFCISAMLAMNGKFCKPVDNPKSIFSQIKYGFNFDERKYFTLLTTLIQSKGIILNEYNEISATENNGEIETVMLDGTTAPHADIYIDCTEDGALITNIGKTIKISDKIPNWIEERSENHEAISPLTSHINYKENSISQAIHYANRTYIKKFSFNEAASTNNGSIQEHSWISNCIALGAAYLRTPNILIAEHLLAINQTLQLVELWRDDSLCPSTKKVFNNFSNTIAQNLTDIDNFFIAHIENSQVQLTESNRERLDLYQTNGSTLATEKSIIPDSHWPILFQLFGYIQKDTNIFSRLISDNEITNQLYKMSQLVRQATEVAPQFKA